MNGTFSSYYLEGNDEDFRTLEVDRMVCIPQGVVCFNVTSNDVIHSFSCPSLGLKVDAVPGKCNSFSLSILQSGIFLGSCAEMCGVNHSFMPFCIVVYRVGVLDYFDSYFSGWFFGWMKFLDFSAIEEISCEVADLWKEVDEFSREFVGFVYSAFPYFDSASKYEKLLLEKEKLELELGERSKKFDSFLESCSDEFYNSVIELGAETGDSSNRDAEVGNEGSNSDVKVDGSHGLDDKFVFNGGFPSTIVSEKACSRVGFSDLF